MNNLTLFIATHSCYGIVPLPLSQNSESFYRTGGGKVDLRRPPGRTDFTSTVNVVTFFTEIGRSDGVFSLYLSNISHSTQYTFTVCKEKKRIVLLVTCPKSDSLPPVWCPRVFRTVVPVFLFPFPIRL